MDYIPRGPDWHILVLLGRVVNVPAVMRKHNKPHPCVVHCSIMRFLGIDQKCNQVVPWSLHTFPENFMQIDPAIFSQSCWQRNKEMNKQTNKEIDQKQYPVPDTIGGGVHIACVNCVYNQVVQDRHVASTAGELECHVQCHFHYPALTSTSVKCRRDVSRCQLSLTVDDCCSGRSVCLCVDLSVCLSVCMSVCLSVCLSVRLSVWLCPSVCLCILCICPSVSKKRRYSIS